jgi:hypothetical protein
VFEQLLDPDFEVLENASPNAIFSAQINVAAEWDDEPLTEDAAISPGGRAIAQQAFTSLIGNAPVSKKREDVLSLKTPEAVRHLVGMLSAYDWDFVEEAKKIRGYVVAKLMEETKHSDARIRLRALQLVGTITEVASFTERSEVVHKQENSGDVEERLRARLKSLLPPTLEVQDAEVREIAVVKHEPKKV